MAFAGLEYSKVLPSRTTILAARCKRRAQQHKSSRVIAQRYEPPLVNGRIARKGNAKDEAAGEEAAQVPAAVEVRFFDAEDEVRFFAGSGNREIVGTHERDPFAFK